MHQEKKPWALILLPWLVFFIAESFYCFQYVLRVSISPMEHALTSSLHINAVSLATIAASFYYAYMVMLFFSGMLIDTFGSRLMLTIATGLLTLGSFIFSLSSNFLFSELGRICMGAGASFSFVGVLTLARKWFNEKTFSIINGLTMAIGTLGAILGTEALHEVIRDYDDSWREVMLYMTIFSVVLTLLVALSVKEPRLLFKPKPLTESNALKQMLLSFKEAIQNRHVWINGFFMAGTYLILITFTILWCIPYFQQIYPQHPALIELFPSDVFIGMAIGSIVFSWLKNKIKKPEWILYSTSFINTVLTPLVLYTTPSSPYLIACYLFIIGTGIGSSVLCFVLVSQWSKPESIASCVAFTNLLSISGGAIMLPIMAWVLEVEWYHEAFKRAGVYEIATYHDIFWFIIGGQILALILSLFLKSKPSSSVIATATLRHSSQ